jgi:hypothetical protein
VKVGRGPLRLSALTLLFVSCVGQREQDRRAEAARLLRAIETLRDADNPKKRDQLKLLEQQSCREPTLCELRDVCVSGYRLHVDALSAVEGAKLTINSKSGTAELGRAALATEAARDQLERAQPIIRRCTHLAGAVQRSVGR